MRWLDAVRADPELAGVGVLVRPHPTNGATWAEHPLGGLPNVAVWPPVGADPTDEERRAGFYDSMYHAAAVVGANTTALIDAAIVGRRTFSVLLPELRGAQEQTLHFHYLLPEHGGALTVAGSLEEHVRQLRDAVSSESPDEGWRESFLRTFVRPHGLSEPAAPPPRRRPRAARPPVTSTSAMPGDAQVTEGGWREPSGQAPIQRPSGSTQAFFRSDGGDPAPLIVVYHIQKTGGTSLRRVVRANLPAADVEIPNIPPSARTPAGLLDWHREWYESLDEARRARLCCVMSHWAGYLLPALDRPAETLALVREPVDRTLSYYHFKQRRRGPDRVRVRSRSSELRDEEDRAADPGRPGRAHGTSSATGRAGLCSRSSTTSRSSSPPPARAPDADLWRERLRELVEHVFLVGVQDRFEQYVDVLARRYGWKAFVPQSKVNPQRPPLSEVSSELRETMLAYNWLDAELYDLCRDGTGSARGGGVVGPADSVGARLDRATAPGARAEPEALEAERSASTEAFFRTDGPHSGPLLVVYHIQKTAGTALREVVRANLPPADVEITPDLRDLRYEPAELLRWYRDWYLALDDDRRARLCCVMSHSAGYLLPALDRPAEALVLVREPVDRVLSFYHEKQQLLRDRARQAVRAAGGDLCDRPTEQGGPPGLVGAVLQLAEPLPALGLPRRLGAAGDRRAVRRTRTSGVRGCASWSTGSSSSASRTGSRSTSTRWPPGSAGAIRLSPEQGQPERPPLSEVSPDVRETIRAHNWLDAELYELCRQAQARRAGREAQVPSVSPLG